MNSLNLLEKDLSEHQVEVILPGEREPKTYSLIIVSALVSMLDDIKNCYPEANATQLKLAEKIFGKGKTAQKYGMFVDPKTLSYTFSFNLAFAAYDLTTKKVVYKDLDEFLLESLEKSGTQSKPNQAPETGIPLPDDDLFSGGPDDYDSHAVFRYAVFEKTAEAK